MGQKTLSEKEKLLAPSIFSFSHNVFHSYISSVRQNAVLCGNGLTLYHSLEVKQSRKGGMLKTF